MGKRYLAGFLALALAGSCLTGCGNAGSREAAVWEAGQEKEGTETENEEADGGKVSLTVWSDQAEFDLLNQMIQSFQKEYAGQADFDIKLEDRQDSETKNNVLGDIHKAADVFPMADDQLAGMAAGGALSKVPDAEEVAGANLKEAVAAASIGDVLYAYPFSADNGYFLYYNKKYFQPEDVESLDRILRVCEKNNKKFYMEWTSGWYLYSFFGNTGLEFGINEDGVTNHCNWNSKKGKIKGLDIAKAMQNIAQSPAFLNSPDGDLVSLAENGQVIAAVSGVWNAVGLEKAWGGYGAVKLPTYTVAGKQVQMASFTGYKMYGVNAYSKHVKWAHALAGWLSNEKNQTLRFEQRSQGPSNSKAADSPAVKAAPAIQAVLKIA